MVLPHLQTQGLDLRRQSLMELMIGHRKLLVIGRDQTIEERLLLGLSPLQLQAKVFLQKVMLQVLIIISNSGLILVAI